MNYSEKFKESMVTKMLSSNDINVRELCEENGISKSALYKWKNEYASKVAIRKDKMPGDWLLSEKFNAIIECSKLSEQDLGQWLRKNGLQSEHLKIWEEEMKKPKLRQDKKELTLAKKKIKDLEKEVHRKDKALAEVSALSAGHSCLTLS